MPISRKRIFRVAAPPPTTIYVRPGYNRVLAEEFEALKVKRVGLVKDKVEAHSQGDLRENFGFKAAKDAIRAVDRKMTALDRFVARNTFIEVDPARKLEYLRQVYKDYGRVDGNQQYGIDIRFDKITYPSVDPSTAQATTTD